ncbi:MAG: hypothetical protein R3191_02830 [Anaerolineales bacterium]|nr:hypothetical protein [Anaerolineales bacterium]
MTSFTRCRVGTATGLYDLGSAGDPAFSGETVRALSQYDGSWWALVGEGQVWRQTEGESWTKLSDPPNERAQCLLPDRGTTLVGSGDAHLYRLERDGLQLIEPFENAPSRERWFTPWGGPPAVRSMTRTSDGTLFVNVHVGGILRSDDGDSNWEQIIEIQSDVHQVHYDERSGLLLAASARGLAVSDDRGDSWEFHRDGLHGSYSRAVAVTTKFILASASTGAHTSRAALYRKPIRNNGPFERCTQGLPEWFGDNINTSCLAAMGETVAFGTESGHVFVSEDHGTSWKTLTEELPPVRCLELV